MTYASRMTHAPETHANIYANALSHGDNPPRLVESFYIPPGLPAAVVVFHDQSVLIITDDGAASFPSLSIYSESLLKHSLQPGEPGFSEVA